MYPALCFEEAVGKVTANFDGGTFQSRHIPLLVFDNRDLKILLFSPACIHAVKHLRPVLAFGTAGTGIKGQDSIAMIIFPAKHIPELKLFKAFLEVFNFLLYFLLNIFSLLLKLKVYLDTVFKIIEIIPALYHAL